MTIKVLSKSYEILIAAIVVKTLRFRAKFIDNFYIELGVCYCDVTKILIKLLTKFLHHL